MPIVLGASVVGLIAQDKQNVMSVLLHGGTARLTADDSLPFARLPIGAPGEGLRGQDSSSPHKRMRGSALSVP